MLRPPRSSEPRLRLPTPLFEPPFPLALKLDELFALSWRASAPLADTRPAERMKLTSLMSMAMGARLRLGMKNGREHSF